MLGDEMEDRKKVKINVLKTLTSKDIFGDTPPQGMTVEACSLLKEGDEFVVNEDGKMPEGFCPWAWNDIYAAVTTLRFGGNFDWMKEKGTQISCCTDGYRPVIFELRRIE
jgi:uncharacterized repeat protein (TIGR04076 family)